MDLELLEQSIISTGIVWVYLGIIFGLLYLIQIVNSQFQRIIIASLLLILTTAVSVIVRVIIFD